MLLNASRRLVLPRLDPVFRAAGRPLVRRKYSDEYQLSVIVGLDRLEHALSKYGYSANPFSTLKYVVDGDVRCYEVGTMVYRERPLSASQFHAYYFRADDDFHKIHVHQHEETSWLRHPLEHMGPGQDPTDQHLRGALNAADINTTTLDDPAYRPSSIGLAP